MELENMTPLTLEQLREMRGEWVYIVLIDGEPKSTAWAIVTGEKLVTYLAFNSSEYLIRAVFDVEECGKAFIAYAYPPAHIDREAWTAEWDVDEFGHKCSKCGEYLPSGDDDITPQFCPSCGRATTTDALAELEKRLRV